MKILASVGEQQGTWRQGGKRASEQRKKPHQRPCRLGKGRREINTHGAERAPTALSVRPHHLTLRRGFCHRPWTEGKTAKAPKLRAPA